jgi:nucleotide-binding universal stress UspA family protein
MKREKTKSSGVLIWAVDPLETETRPSKPSFRAAYQWAKAMGWEIHPVTVITPSRKDLERGLLGSVNHAQSALDSYLKKFRGVRAGHVLVNEKSSQDSAVAKLLRYAKEEGASAIAVSSHGRRGLDRLVLGSFAEKMLATSPVPVFFLNHRVSPAKKDGRNLVVFPTNFSDASWSAFRDFLREASGKDFDVILFHAITYPLALDAGMGMYLPDGYVEDEEKWARNQGQRWADEAKKHGVRAEAATRSCGIGFVNGDAVLDFAKETGALAIVLTSTGNGVARFLVGSVALPVFRANQFPTLVYGPKARVFTGRGAEFTFAQSLG